MTEPRDISIDDPIWGPEGKPAIFMNEAELKATFDGKICGECGKPFNFRVVREKDGGERIYPHGIWEARKDWVRRHWFWILLSPILFPLYLALGIYLLYYYWRYQR